MTKKSLSNRNILMILPHKKFQEEEYEEASAIFKKALAKVIVASSQKTAEGIYGTTVTTNLVIREVNAKQFDAIILIGGVGSIEYWHSDEVVNLLKDANKYGKLICAICLAPVILANAGLLKNKKATAYYSSATYLRSKGAFFTGNPVEISGNIITANRPESTKEFALAIVDSLTDQKALISGKSRQSN